MILYINTARYKIKRISFILYSIYLDDTKLMEGTLYQMVEARNLLNSAYTVGMTEAASQLNCKNIKIQVGN